MGKADWLELIEAVAVLEAQVNEPGRAALKTLVAAVNRLAAELELAEALAGNDRPDRAALAR